MSYSKSRLTAAVAALAVAASAGLAWASMGGSSGNRQDAARSGAVLLVADPASDARETAPQPPSADSGLPPDEDAGRGVRVQVPYADIDVDRANGRVRVRAPYTAVDVDQGQGRIKVRAPFFNLDIRW
jgi:hypothetical protein